MIYLDHAATTQPYSEVTETLCHYMQNLFFNPAALYGPAIDLETAIKDALSRIGRTLGCDGRQLIVTSGATESTNTAIKGYCHAHRRRGNKIVITSGEHSATRESALFLESEGFEVERIPLTKDGVADLAVLKRALTPDVLLVSVIGVNNETGAVNDVETIAELKREFCPEAALHVDYVQGWNRLPLQLDNSGIDLASFSGHKIHGPKGIGLLYCREGIRLSPLIHGGGQQANRRSGTEHPAAVLALAKAAEIGSSRRRNMSIVRIREFLLSELDQLNVQYLRMPEQLLYPIYLILVLRILKVRHFYICWNKIIFM